MTRFFEYHTPAPNSSNAICGQLLVWMDKYVGNVKFNMLLVEEQPQVNSVFLQYFPECSISNINYMDEVNGMPFDLNVITPLREEYDVVYNQATLEHVCRPSIAIENMVSWTRPGGYTFLHTHIPGFGYHPWPRDCVRFFEDFFVDLRKYIPVDFVDIAVHNEEDIFVAYRRK